MENIFTTLTADQELSLILGIAVILMSILFACVAIREYMIYLDDHYKARPSLKDFIKQEQFYLYLWLILVAGVIQIKLMSYIT